MTKRVLLAMSGGVDSSVAAHLLVREGYEVVGLFMRTGVSDAPERQAGGGGGVALGSAPPPTAPLQGGGQSRALPVVRPSGKRGCCSAVDAGDARRVAEQLDIPFYAANFERDFGRIIDYFAGEYLRGRTPNPCVVCNNWLKFGRLWEYAQAVDADYIATGHYARVTADHPVPALRRAVDGRKDQSYVLFGLRRELLPRVLLPIGEMQKDEVRSVARSLGLRVADKPDSQEICFVPDGDYAALVRHHRRDAGATVVGGDHRRDAGATARGGEIVDTAGRVLGRHGGVAQFTIGQRKGLGIAVGSRRYVVELDAEARRVVVGTRDELARRELVAERVNWLIDPPTGPLVCEAKIRYHHTPAAAVVVPEGGADRVRVRFDEPQYAIAPGQAVVFYEDDRVLGGGWIC